MTTSRSLTSLTLTLGGLLLGTTLTLAAPVAAGPKATPSPQPTEATAHAEITALCDDYGRFASEWAQRRDRGTTYETALARVQAELRQAATRTDAIRRCDTCAALPVLNPRHYYGLLEMVYLEPPHSPAQHRISAREVCWVLWERYLPR
jgi:hypothetical protein